MTDEIFSAYLTRRKAASDAFVAGDVAPLHEVSTASDPATILGPAGTLVQGAESVNATNAEGSARFTGAERNDLETIHGGEEGDLAWWVGVQRSVVSVEGQDEPVPMDLRVTELYRREDGAWKLFHRHADPLRES
ncbi:YybH family protein [Phycicoccus sonneratiae]|uniref:Nuclear transport factor 2 family protein n=1 Tax=Phycicoccus sonneratiae TaxID=2807628 RepID=A0ABS2CPZ8_9MICO|nr:nuclear transport factor 2 family protein [Phycicoccus sonneraticus]MBM6401201.1 nuclear transport factor 2 family protein [Phycicoccus sonneraticus]